MIVVAAFEAPTVVAGFHDVAMVSQAVEERGGHLGVAEHAGPFTEGKIGGDDDGRALVEPADEMEQQLFAGLGERQVAEFVENDEVHPGSNARRCDPAVHCGSRSPDGVTRSTDVVGTGRGHQIGCSFWRLRWPYGFCRCRYRRPGQRRYVAGR